MAIIWKQYLNSYAIIAIIWKQEFIKLEVRILLGIDDIPLFSYFSKSFVFIFGMILCLFNNEELTDLIHIMFTAFMPPSSSSTCNQSIEGFISIYFYFLRCWFTLKQAFNNYLAIRLGQKHKHSQ